MDTEGSVKDTQAKMHIWQVSNRFRYLHKVISKTLGLAPLRKDL